MVDGTLPKVGFDQRVVTPYLLVAVELSLAFLAGTTFTLLGAAAGAWILGGIAAGAMVFYVHHHYLAGNSKPNRNLRKLGQLLIGLAIGFSIQQGNLASLTQQLPVFGLITLCLLLSGVGIGSVYSRLENCDLLSGVLATVPGNIGVMASIAADYNRNTALVSLVQLVRFTAVVFLVPTLAHVSYSHDLDDVLGSLFDQTVLSPFYLIVLAIVLLVTALAVYLGGKLKIPVAAFLCSIAVGVGFNAAWNQLPDLPAIDFNLPPLLKVIGQILLGTTIGEYWGLNPRLRPATLMRVIIPVGLTFGAGGIAAAVAHWLTGWDWLTCLLVSAPGGSPEMIWIALSLNHQVEVVTAGHLVRLLAINFTLPFLVSLGCYLERRQSSEPV